MKHEHHLGFTKTGTESCLRRSHSHQHEYAQCSCSTTTTHAKTNTFARQKWNKQKKKRKNSRVRKKTNKPGKRSQPLAIKIIIREEDLKFYASLRAQNERPKNPQPTELKNKAMEKKRRRNKTR